MPGRGRRRAQINAERAAAGLPPLAVGESTVGVPVAQRAPSQPYREGNTESLRHGARSGRVLAALSAEIVEAVLGRRPDLAAYPEEVSAWATAEAQARLLRRDVDVRGVLDDDGTPRESVVRMLERCERRAAQGRARLGLDPRSEAALAVERAAAARVGGARSGPALDRLLAQGRDVLGTDVAGTEGAGRVLDEVRRAGRLAAGEPAVGEEER